MPDRRPTDRAGTEHNQDTASEMDGDRKKAATGDTTGARRIGARIRALPGGRTALRIGVATTGTVLVALGLVLVPLPGPGWAIVFGGLAVWAIEFAWARKLLDRVRRTVRAATARVRRLPRPVSILIGAVVMTTVAGLAWLWIDQRYGADVLDRLWDYLRTH